MNVRSPLMLGLFAAAVVSAACGATSPLAGTGTKTSYDLRIDSVTPHPLTVKVGKTVAFTVWMTDNASGLMVTGTTPTAGSTADATKAIVVPNGTGKAGVKGVAAGATTLTATYFEINNGITYTAPSTVAVTVTP